MQAMEICEEIRPKFDIGIFTKSDKIRLQRYKSINKNKKKKKNTSEPYQVSFSFDPYMGPCHTIPSGLLKKANQSVQCKFQVLSTCKESEFLSLYVDEINKSFFKAFIIFSISPWIPPATVRARIQSFKDKDANDWAKVKMIYRKVFKLKHLLRTLIHRRIIRLSMRNCINIFDAATMDIPKKPVYIINFAQKCSYIYEASTLLRTIQSKLLISDYMFPDPKEPVNLFTNQPFTMGQYISIFSQCKGQGEFSWLFDRFKASGFNIGVFSNRFKQQLKLEAVDYYFKNQPYAAESTVIDYFLINAEYASLPTHIIGRFKNSFNYKNPSNYVRSWINISKNYYKAFELKDTVALHNIGLECDILIQKAYLYFMF
jgi:hypothetical protein